MAHQPLDSARLFDALSHPTRIKILRLIHERPRSFAELKHQLALESSGHLQYHMGKLVGLVVDNGRYSLTVSGLGALKIVEESEQPEASLESLCSVIEGSDSGNDPTQSTSGDISSQSTGRRQRADFFETLGFKLHIDHTLDGERVF